MKVITLDPSRFRQACLDLLRQSAFGDQTADIIVGIRTGGFVVAEEMRSSAPAATLCIPITRRRPSTAVKQANPWICRLLRALPYFVTDAIRVAEHRLISGPKARAKSETAIRSGIAAFEPDAEENAALTAALTQRPGARILLVDDAVDTGVTLHAVLTHIRKIAPAAEVKTVAIVTTTPAPVTRPDVCLYSNVLCRFPWSHDFSG